MKRPTPWLILLVLGVVLGMTACASTPSGRLLQTGSVLLALNETAYNACQKSKAAGWQPIPRRECERAADAFIIASGAWEQAERVMSSGGTPSAAHLVPILLYMFQTVDLLQSMGVPIPDRVQEYTQAVRRGLSP